ncbi:MAG: 3-oxoacyl-ACP reductase FabG [Clostridia bacterium]
MKDTVLITGASRGIGAAIAYAFAQQGHRVILHGNAHMEDARQLCAALSAQHLSVMNVQAELTDPAQVQSMIDRVHIHFGKINVLVNNAGVALPQQLLTDCTDTDWDRIFNVNAKGMFLVTKTVLPDMIAKQHGSIINISSMWGVTGGSCEVPYSSSKAAVIGFTKALAKEMAPSGVRVNCIAPGFVMTNMNADLTAEAIREIVADTPLLRAGMPEDIASAALFFASEASSFITGEVLHVDGGRCI